MSMSKGINNSINSIGTINIIDRMSIANRRGEIIRLAICLCLCAVMVLSPVILTGCKGHGAAGGLQTKQASSQVRFLSIEGDVEVYRSFSTGAAVISDKAKPGDTDFEGVALNDFLADSKPSGVIGSVWLIASGDGYAAQINGKDLDKAYMIFSAVTGWTIVAPDFPPSAQVKDIDRIVVCSKWDSANTVGLTVVTKEGQKSLISMWQLALMPNAYENEGEATNENSGISVDSYYEKHYFMLKNFLHDLVPDDATLELIMADGSSASVPASAASFYYYRQTIECINGDVSDAIYDNVTEVRIK